MKDPSRTNPELIKEISAPKQKIEEPDHPDSKRKREKEALYESEERYRLLTENIKDVVWIMDAETMYFRYVSPSVERLRGYTPEEILAEPATQALTAESAEYVINFTRSRSEALLSGKETSGNFFTNEAEQLCKDGSTVWTEVITSYYINPENGRVEVRGVTRDITERKRAEDALKKSEEQYRTLVENANDIVFRLDATGRITFVNPAALRITGYEEREIIGRHYPTFVRPDVREESIKFFSRQFVKGIPNSYSEYPVIAKDGREIWLGQNTQLIFQDGRAVAFQAVARDITDRKRVEEELRQSRDAAERMAQEVKVIAEIGKVIGSTLDTGNVYERFAAETQKLILFDSLTVNLYNLQENIMSVAYVSGLDIDGRRQGDPLVLEGSLSEAVIRARTSHRIQPASIDEIIGRFPRLSPIFRAGLRSIICVPLLYMNEVIGVLHFRSKKPNAYTERDLWLAERIGEQIAGAIANAQLYAGIKKAEGELKKSEQRYRELSIIDDLTQLYNSRHFYFQLKIELDRSNRYEQPLTLLLLDLDNFKSFNDAYGHVEGDRVLWRLGQVIKRCLRETDFAYRYGGEEFTILLPMTTSADGAVTAERIRMEFNKETFSPVPDQEVHVTMSIGLAQYRAKEEMKAFVHRVDQLMYQGKKNGKDRVCCEP